MSPPNEQLETCEVLIIGCGIAGACFSRILQENGKSFYIIDSPELPSASQHSAGILNPVTGKQFTLSWQYPELMQIAIPFYKNWLTSLGVESELDTSIYRILSNAKQLNDWDYRLENAEYQSYIYSDLKNQFKHILKDDSWHTGKTLNSFQIPVSQLLTKWMDFLRSINCLIEETVDFSNFSAVESRWKYRNILAKKVIFCEGFRVIANPFFDYLPLIPNKGDALIVEINDFPEKVIFKKNIFIAPWNPTKNQFWVGSTYNRNDLSDEPSSTSFQFLESELKDMIKMDFKIVKSISGIRPTVKDRKPLLGQHPQHQHVYILNGFGTKGASLAPYMANTMYNHMFEDQELPREIDIARFNS